MECHCIPLRELPRTSRLFADYTDNFARVSGFYAHAPTLQGIRAAARGVNLPADVRRQVVAILREQNRRWGADPAVMENLDRLAAGALAVVSGQQVGLFSGPAYSFYKALSTLAAAAGLRAAGLDAVPVFWLATEDHDLAEVNHCFFSGRKGLARVELNPADSQTGRRVGEVRLGPAVGAAVRQAADLLEGPAAEEIREALREGYRPEETYGSAFAKLFTRLLAGRGLILLDPLDARWHRLAVPIYQRALEDAEALNADLLARSRALEKAGYHGQVKVTETSTLLFVDRNGQRLPVRRHTQGFVVGRSSFSAGELREVLEKSPQAFTANVLLRPVVQDALLPTVAYVAGPAEVAYFAQAEVVYRHLLVQMPAVVSRASYTLAPPRQRRLLAKYELTLREVLGGRQRLRRRMERAFLAPKLEREFTAGERAIRRSLARLRAPLGKLDGTLDGALDTAERKILYQFEKLRAKAGRARNFRSGVLDAHERLILDTLYPRHALQERSVCLLAFLAQSGMALLDELQSRAGIENLHHHVLFL